MSVILFSQSEIVRYVTYFWFLRPAAAPANAHTGHFENKKINILPYRVYNRLAYSILNVCFILRGSESAKARESKREREREHPQLVRAVVVGRPAADTCACRATSLWGFHAPSPPLDQSAVNAAPQTPAVSWALRWSAIAYRSCCCALRHLGEIVLLYFDSWRWIPQGQLTLWSNYGN